MEIIRHTLTPFERKIEAAQDRVGIVGIVLGELFDGDGTLIDYVETHNLITDKGDQYYGERAAGIASPPGQVTGMRLGTGVTAASKTGAGAAIGTYITGSNAAIVGGFPTSSQPGGAGTARFITWQATWGAGVATANSISEAAITNETPLTDVAGTAANTISRVVLSPVINKGVNDSFTLTWIHALLGA